MIKNLRNSLTSLANFISVIQHLSISQWDVGPVNTSLNAKTIEQDKK